MKYIIALLFFCIVGRPIFSQTSSKIWHFGINAGIDFNYNPPSKISNGNHSFYEGGVTLTDENGDVLFYVDENTVYNRSNLPMLNGRGLIGNTGSSAQSPIALQDLKNPEHVYIFYVADHFDPNVIGQLRYSVIDLCGDNGKGSVLNSKKNTRIPGQYTERLSATYDPIKNRYWILTSDYNTHNTKVFELSENGLNLNPVTSYLSDNSSPSYIGMIAINKQQNKIAYTCGLSGGFRGVILADFDINTGSVSNAVKIHENDIYDAVFSSNGRYLYVTDIFADCVLYKFDLQDRSKDKILFEKNGNYAFTALEEGPDGKIYLAIESDNSIGRIEMPDQESEGFNSNFLQYASPAKVTAGLQSTHYFKQIIRERKVKNELGNDTIICGEINIELISGLDQAKWSNGASGKSIIAKAAGQYYYYWRDCGIMYSDTINILFQQEINTEESLSQTFCKGDSIILKVPDNNYVWQDGSQGDQFKIKNAGIYFSTYKEGCITNLRVFNITMDTLLSLPDIKDTSYCISSNFKLSIPELFTVYNIKNEKIPENQLSMLNGVYAIKAQNICGQIEKKVTIKVDSIPNIPLESYVICSTLDFPITLSTDVSATIWNSNVESKDIIISEPGTYSYLVNNSCGEFKGEISVSLNNLTTLPNVFSPNGDGINDFFPGLSFLENFKLEIYDRWGNLVHQGNSDWDGNGKGKSVESGVYTYKLLSLNCKNNLNGTITVLR